MKLRGLLTLAMAAQVIVTAAALLVSYAATGTGFGIAQIVALLASGATAVLLARLCTRAIETAQEKRAAALLTEQAQASAQMTQAVIKTALACACSDRKSTRLNSSHPSISYAVFCLKKKKQPHNTYHLIQYRAER